MKTKTSINRLLSWLKPLQVFSGLFLLLLFLLPLAASAGWRQNTGFAQAIPPTPDAAWSERFSLSGDLRLRRDQIDSQNESGQDEKTRIRHRYRLRLNAKALLDEEMRVVLRLASGESRQPVNSNEVTFTDGFANKDVYFDLAYLHWDLLPQLHLQLGKVPLPFYSPGRRHLLWDPDITPEGLALLWNQSLPRGWVFSRLGAFVMQEYAAESDSYLYSAQLGWGREGLSSGLLLGAGLYHFTRLKDRPMMYHRDFGNSSYEVGPSGSETLYFGENYEVAQVFAEFSWQGAFMPLRFVVDYGKNLAVTEQGESFVAGVLLGETRKVGDVYLSYDYRFMQRDSQVGALTDGWFVLAQKDSRGHSFNLIYNWREHSTWRIRHLLAQTDLTSGAPRDFYRVVLDLNTRF